MKTVNRLPFTKGRELQHMAMPVQIVRESLGPQVATGLRDAIVAGELAAGSRLIEADLANQYGVSRGPIRDAFRILQTEGLVEGRRQGVVVTGIEVADINEIYSLRGALEGLALRRLNQAGGREHIDALEAAVSRMQSAADALDQDGFGVADIEFHNTLCVLSGHRRLADVWAQYKEIMMALLRQTIFAKDHDLQQSSAKHMMLFRLIESGRAAEAEEELAAHLEGSRQRMVQFWQHAMRGDAVSGEL